MFIKIMNGLELYNKGEDYKCQYQIKYYGY